MATVEERIHRNNRTFREANEQINARATELDAPMERIPFLCECPTEACTEIVYLTLVEYGDLRAHDGHFMTKIGHEEAERPVGTVVSREDGYVIVEKSVD